MEFQGTKLVVWQLIRALNRSWTTRESIDTIGQYFADTTVALVSADTFAVVSYEFNISLERDGQKVEATNRDSFALAKIGDQWLIVLATV